MTDNKPWIHPDHPVEMTLNMRAYCEEYVRNGEIKMAAYNVAYPLSKGKLMTRKKAVTQLGKDERINHYIAVLQNQVQQEVVYELSDHVSKLQEIRDAAMADRSWAAATSAEKAIGSAVGHQNAGGSRDLDTKVAPPTLSITRPDRNQPSGKLKAAK
jgi:hypothetical protein